MLPQWYQHPDRWRGHRPVIPMSYAPDVAGVNDTRLVPVTIGARSLSMFSLSAIEGGITPVAISGRKFRGDDEIALAPLTAKVLGVKPGSRCWCGVNALSP
jgi:hypothetical protein